MALVLAIIGTAIALLSLFISVLTYYRNGPVVRVSFSTATVIERDAARGRALVEVVNTGRATVVIRRIVIVSTSSIASWSPAESNTLGPKFPTAIAPTEARTWMIDFQVMKTAILDQYPGEHHILRAKVLYGSRSKLSKGAISLESGSVPSKRSIAGWVRSRFSAQVQGYTTTPQPRFYEGFQRLTLVNFGKGVARDVMVDLTSTEHGTLHSTRVEEVDTRIVRWIWGGRSADVYLPIDVDSPPPGELFWRIRWRTLLGHHGQMGVGFLDREALQRVMDAEAKSRGWSA